MPNKIMIPMCYNIQEQNLSNYKKFKDWRTWLIYRLLVEGTMWKHLILNEFKNKLETFGDTEDYDLDKIGK